MIYLLTEENNKSEKPFRVYRNTTTGSETRTELIFTDKDGGKWWGFSDLFKIPVMRVSMARHITDLYNIGLSLKDITDWCKQEKALIRSNDPERYEKLYSLILEKERIVKNTADPIRQHLALCTVYIVSDEERIDYFDEAGAEAKLKLWLGLPEMVSFFLSWHNVHIQNYMNNLNKISETVSQLQAKDLKKAQPKE